MNKNAVDKIILAALDEDIGTGDITTESCIPYDAKAKAVLRAKEDGILCGIGVFARVFELLDKGVVVTPLKADGDKLAKGDVFCRIEGNARSVLTGERTALNILQRMSGIATQTSAASAAIAGTRARVTETRKTTPGLRVLEKYAVKVGGGANHRFNLSDGVLIKDNHIVAAGGITQAVNLSRNNIPHTLKIEVETGNLDEVREALAAGADIIMFDNMSNDLMREAVAVVNGRALTEASGNMGDKNLREVAETGVDIISIGALTHRIKSLDISMVFEK
jgi:nicotinate-nucleotide pyrophosphorylase (carboxylating)